MTVRTWPLPSSGNATPRTSGAAIRTPGRRATALSTASGNGNPSAVVTVAPRRPPRPSTVSEERAQGPRSS